MGCYRLSIYYGLHFGFGVGFKLAGKFLTIQIPFLELFLSFDKEAKGFYFGDE